jgi:hypothetical protein
VTSTAVEKKLYWMSRVGRIEIDEPLYRCRRRQLIRPFVLAAKVHCRAYSLGLQRAVTDFAAVESFQQAAQRLDEHYGIQVSPSMVRALCQQHAGQLLLEHEDESLELPAKGVEQAIAELDGSFIPIVESKDGKGDKRKRREHSWREVRLGCVRAEGRVERQYGVSMGSVEAAGRAWKRSAIKAGVGQQTQIHGVSDGAGWIVEQLRQQFGERATYLVDFYHLSEYLGAVASHLEGEAGRRWLRLQQQRLKSNKVAAVESELAKLISDDSGNEPVTAAVAAARYMKNHRQYLNYRGAIEKGLPIGSGEVESGHRVVVQKRLKISGAWWRPEQAEKMLALQECRANGEWQAYWKKQCQVGA